MRRHWAYFKYVMWHKWYVFVAGLTTGAPLWNLIIHDWTKFQPVEWVPYAYTFYNSDGSKNEDRDDKHPDFSDAWEHHYNSNPHHWQYWLSQVGSPKPMPIKYVREMVADWMGANKAQGGGTITDFVSWFENAYPHMKLNDRTRQKLKEVFAEIGYRKFINLNKLS